MGFSPKLIKNIYGACKIYDTRSGIDPEFPEELLNDAELLSICNKGLEYGTTTGRKRKVNWLDINKLKTAINISGTTHLIISKLDIFEALNIFKLKNCQIVEFNNMDSMKKYLEDFLKLNCNGLDKIIYSNNPINVDIIE